MQGAGAPPSAGGGNGPGLGPQGPMGMGDGQGQPGQGPPGNRPPPIAGRPLRELKVEDALLYLDQVKMEFGDKPEIYNEFLDIMKNFKAQAIDTPGVIDRVSTLFRGYNKLILGFNTFLPDGYKIELSDIEEMNRVHAAKVAAQAEAQRRAHALPSPPSALGPPGGAQRMPGGPMIPGGGGGGGGGGGAPLRASPQPTPQGAHMQQQQRGSGGQMPPQQQHPGSARGGGGGGGGGLEQAGLGLLMPQMGMFSGGGVGGGGGGSDMRGGADKMAMPRPGAQVQGMGRTSPGAQFRPVVKLTADGRIPHAIPMVNAAGELVAEQPAEFDHAISYVTTIKKRFSTEPQTYKAFLEILHTYQKEQRGIKDVLEQVSSLFADHPDLLREFTYFLPDPVQDQARERLNRAAQESEERRRRADMQLQNMGMGFNGGRGGDGRGGDGGYGGGPRVKPKEKRRKGDKDGGRGGGDYGRDRSASPAPDRHEQRRGSGAPGPSGRKGDKGTRGGAPPAPGKVPRNGAGAGGARAPPAPRPDPERSFFEFVRETLMASGGREAWAEFLKCVDMYSAEIFTRREMLQLVADLFGPHQELFADFKRLIEGGGIAALSGGGSGGGADGGGGTAGALTTDVWYSTPLAEIDFSQCRKCTPSYRALPKDYPRPSCSERSYMEDSVLNDTWVSVPVGSEDSSNFKHMRKNQYEEALFRCEDERFEIDMVIDSTTSTIKLLEPLAEEIAQLAQHGSNAHYQFKLDKRTLGVVHLNAITRIYGDRGAEVLELLRKNPAGAVPLILKRLKQKDTEWRQNRSSLDRQWRDLLERTYHKSLDRRSFYFKSADRRAYGHRALLAEIRDLAAARAAEEDGAADDGDDKTAATASAAALGAPHFMSPHMDLAYAPREVQRDAHFALLRAVEAGSYAASDRDRMRRICVDALPDLFGWGAAWLAAGAPPPPPTAADDAGARAAQTQYRAGCPVFTAFGEGKVIDARGDGTHGVELPGCGVIAVGPAHIFRILHEGPGAYANPRFEDNEFLDSGAGEGGGEGGEAGVMVPLSESLLLATQELYLLLRMRWMVADRMAAARHFCEAAALRRARARRHPMKAAGDAQPADAAADAAAADAALAQSLGLRASVLPAEGLCSYPGFMAVLHMALGTETRERGGGVAAAAAAGGGGGGGGGSGGGGDDALKFVDYVQGVLGNEAFALFSLDKQVQTLARQLKVVADDPMSSRLLELWRYQRAQAKPAGALRLSAYCANVGHFLRGRSDDVYRLQFTRAAPPTPSPPPSEAAAAAEAALAVVHTPEAVTRPGATAATVAAAATAAAAAAAPRRKQDESGGRVLIEFVGVLDKTGRAADKKSAAARAQERTSASAAPTPAAKADDTGPQAQRLSESGASRKRRRRGGAEAALAPRAASAAAAPAERSAHDPPDRDIVQVEVLNSTIGRPGAGTAYAGSRGGTNAGGGGPYPDDGEWDSRPAPQRNCFFRPPRAFCRRRDTCGVEPGGCDAPERNLKYRSAGRS